MNGRRKLVLANRRNSVRVNCVAQFRRMSRTMLPCRRSYNNLKQDVRMDSKLCSRWVLAGVYRWAKFSWNLGCYACSVLSPLKIHVTCHRCHYVKMRRYLQNRKYMTYRNAARRGLSQGHAQHAQKLKFGHAVFELGKRTDKQTDITFIRTPLAAKKIL